MLSKLIKLYSEDIDNLAKHKIERDKGFILYGEPGTGKTMLCKAFANELDGVFVYLSMEQFMTKKNVSDIDEIAGATKQNKIFKNLTKAALDNAEKGDTTRAIFDAR